MGAEVTWCQPQQRFNAFNLFSVAKIITLHRSTSLGGNIFKQVDTILLKPFFPKHFYLSIERSQDDFI